MNAVDAIRKIGETLVNAFENLRYETKMAIEIEKAETALSKVAAPEKLETYRAAAQEYARAFSNEKRHDELYRWGLEVEKNLLLVGYEAYLDEYAERLGVQTREENRYGE